MNSRTDIPGMGEVRREYPPALLEKCELLECFCDRGDTRTLLARLRDGDALAVVKCFLAGSPLYDREEPAVLRALDAPPLPRFIAEYRSGEMRCVVREYVPGRTLADLAGEKRLSPEEVIDIGTQLCDQLRSLHGLTPPVVHRDIKPQNVVLRPDGRAVLIDFGISRVVSEDSGDTLVYGTRGFSPPEQYGFAQTDARSDIFSLGMLMNWLLRGDAPLPERPGTALERVIARCAAFAPDERFSSAERVKRALAMARPRAQRRRRWLAAACALALIAAAVGIAAGVSRRMAEGVAFSQPLMERAARLSLGLSEEERLTKERLAAVEGIYIVADEAFPDADGFYAAVNQWYADGRPARGTMTELSDLALMPGVRQVCVAAQSLNDVSALAALEQLNRVELKHNDIEDISALAGMEKLTSVGINDNPVRDVSPLAECPNLAFLDLCDVRSYDPAVIARLGNFDYLDLSNPTGSYGFLDGKSVLTLKLNWTGLTDLSVLDGVSRLEELEIGHTAVTDLSPLARHPGLRRLRLDAVPARDLSPLLELPLLERVVVSEDLLPLVEALGEVGFGVETA